MGEGASHSHVTAVKKCPAGTWDTAGISSAVSGGGGEEGFLLWYCSGGRPLLAQLVTENPASPSPGLMKRTEAPASLVAD